MKARDRIDRRAARIARLQEIPGRRAQQRLLHRLARHAAIATTARDRDCASAARSASVSACELSHLALAARASAAKSGAGESVTKVESRLLSREISSTTCLMRKWPNETPASPRWQLEIE